MRRLLVALAALLLVLACAPPSAAASDEDRSGTSSGGSSDDSDDDDSGDTPDDSDGRDDDDDEDDDDDGDDIADDVDVPPPTGGAVGGGGTSPTGPAAATVQVEDRAFTPAAVRVAVGGTVTWNNVSRDHTVTADDGSFDSGVFDSGASFGHTFSAAGTFAYVCLIHPEMTGTVTVGDAGVGPTARGGSGGSGGGASGSSSSGAAAGSGLPAIAGGAVPAPLTAAAIKSADVDVLDFEFAPSNVTVNPGATVRWTLRDRAPHTVTSDSFDSGMLKAGDVYEQSFNDVGEFAYRCDFHPDMTGTVTVAAVDGAPPPTDGGADAAGGESGGSGPASDDAQAAVSAGSGSLLADSGFRGLPAFAFALAVILLGWAALVSGRRRLVRKRTTV